MKKQPNPYRPAGIWSVPAGRGEINDPANLAATITGGTFAVITDLIPGETYDTLVEVADAKWSQNLGGFSHTFRYMVGAVPVIQEVFVTFKGELELSTKLETAAAIHVQADKELTFGFEWDSAAGYSLITDSGFNQTVTLDLSAGIQAKARLKIYPEIATRFYKCLKTSIHVIPSVGLETSLRMLPPPVEMTQCELDFQVAGHVEANLKILVMSEKWGDEKCVSF